MGKVGFWCPEDVEQGVNALIQQGVYRDRSKALVALLRQALHPHSSFPSDLQARVDSLASMLHRSPDAIVTLCVEGIFEMIDRGTTTPLIVEEVQLRQNRALK
jgi:hypothetical protein